MPKTKNYNPKRKPMQEREARHSQKAAEEANLPANPDADSESAQERLSARARAYEQNPSVQLHQDKEDQHYRPYYQTRKLRGFTPAKKEIFIFTLAEFGTPSTAAEAVGISPATAKDHRNPNSARYDPDFAEAWEEAMQEYNASVENEIHRRAIVGWDEPVFGGKNKDRVVGHIRKKSDRLLTTLAKRRMPQEYGDKVQVEQKGGTNPDSTQIAPGVDIAQLTSDQRRKLKAFLTSMDGVDRSEIIEGKFEPVNPDDEKETEDA